MSGEPDTSGAPDQAIPARCSWCGRENYEKLKACAGCGTQLVAAPPRVEALPAKAKSKPVAIVLALLFGPLGLLYASPAGAVTIFLIALPFVVTRAGGLWLSLAARIASAGWAFYSLSVPDPESDPSADSIRLLEEAARLESVDRDKAIAAYSNVVDLFPDTAAGKEAAHNLDILRRTSH